MSDAVPEFSQVVERLEAVVGVKRHSFEDRTSTSIYKNVSLKRILDIEFNGSFFAFVEDEKRLDELIRRFDVFNASYYDDGAVVYTRSPIGSGFKAELRLTRLRPLPELFAGHRISSSAASRIQDLYDLTPFRILSWGASFLVGRMIRDDVDLQAAARTIAANFPLLHDHYSACMPEAVNVAEATADDLRSSGTFYLKW